MSYSVRPHRWQPSRLPSPWDSPGKNTGVCCHFLLQCMKVKSEKWSRVRLLATPWTAAYQAPPSMGFSRESTGVGCHCLLWLYGKLSISSVQFSRSVVSNSVRPHRRQPTRLPRPWDSPGKNTGVGCHFLLQCMKLKSESEVAQLCPTLSDPMDCSLPGSYIYHLYWYVNIRRKRVPTPVFLGFLCASAGKEPAYNVGDLGLFPVLGRYPGEGKGYPLYMSNVCIYKRVSLCKCWN